MLLCENNALKQKTVNLYLFLRESDQEPACIDPKNVIVYSRSLINFISYLHFPSGSIVKSH